MDLFEFQGKALFRAGGVPVPNSEFLDSADATPTLPYPFVLKAQTMSGGRGKAGGIQICNNLEEYQKHAKDILNLTIKGKKVHALLAEEMVTPDRELYLAITLQGVSTPTLIASAMGGINIEQVAAEHPSEIIRMEIDPTIGLKDYQRRDLALALNLPNNAVFAQLLSALQGVFFKKDALLTEINPLGVVGDKLIAMDSKVVLDGQAEFRQGEIFSALADENKAIGVPVHEDDGTTITYVPLKGEIGLISDGAGTGMLCLDMLSQSGGQLASFCELGGTTSADVMYKAMEYTFQNSDSLKSVLISLIGGFNRMDDMANGIIRYLQDHPSDCPIFTRMCGTKEAEGLLLMREAGLVTYSDLNDAVELASKAGRSEV